MYNIFIKWLCIALFSTTPLTAAWAFNYNINVDTSSLAGSSATLAFDFINGDGAVNNIIQITNFQTDGSIVPDSATFKGDINSTGNSSATFGDSSFFNELLLPVTLGSSVQFQLHSSNLFASTGVVPDAFTFFILDGLGSLSLFPTTDTTGSDALFALDLNGTDGGLSVFVSTTAKPEWTVQPIPLPGAFSMMLVAGIWSALLNRKRRSV